MSKFKVVETQAGTYGIVRASDDAVIPHDPMNADYQEFLKEHVNYEKEKKRPAKRSKK